MLRTPNDEQKLAIEHDGGVLLSAGAGSGKTFVLVEHIIYLIKEIENKYELLEEKQKYFKEKISNTVLMTFTKKAAGELQIRLNNRIKQQLEFENDQTFWSYVSNHISTLYIGTIHGFCHKLIKEGLVPDINSEMELISESQYKIKLELLFDLWISKENKIDLNIKNSFLMNKNSILSSVFQVFSDPSLRSSWDEKKLEEIINFNIEEHFLNILDLLEIKILFKQSSMNDSIEDKYKEKPYYIFAAKLLSFLKSIDLNSENVFETLNNFLIENKSVRAPQKRLGLTELNNIFDEFKTLKDFISKNLENYEAFFQHKEVAFLNWMSGYKSLYEFMKDNYLLVPGIQFGDLEYFIFKAIQNKEVVNKISQRYKYFIVDEFQDTSYVQYEIIRELINNDLLRLFCVGDVKQAIYGFRGGELGVFLNCQKQIPQNLNLSNNYRSTSNVIKFNNSLFENLFQKSFSFEGVDNHNVVADPQSVPDVEKSSEGSLNCVKVEISNTEIKRIYSEGFDVIESKVFCDLIEELIFKDPNSTIAVLYKKLKPSKVLQKDLQERGIGFTAQNKISIGEDPIISLFLYILEGLLEDQKDNSFKLNKLAAILELEFKNLEYVEQEFKRDVLLYGVKVSFDKFLSNLYISNSNFETNYNLINELINNNGNDIEKLYLDLKKLFQNKYSMDYSSKGKGNVLIMTAHASKGLEFDHVFIGGLHTNGKSVPNTSYSGKLPGSLKWKSSYEQKSPFTSPELILENLLTKYKDFAESKRLFYVTNTRAQESLYWCDISLNGKAIVSDSNSWINGIRSWFFDVCTKSNSIDKEINIINTSLENLNQEIVSKSLLFHRDRFGIVENENKSNLYILPELSVTRLALIEECPRKFYLKNICKLDEELSLTEEINFELQKEENQLEDVVLKSSASRGTLIHELISKMIKKNFTVPLNTNEHEEILLWVKGQLQKYFDLDYEMRSEEPMKFDFFGQMLSGTPDLFFFKEDDLQVWDFKTGRPNEIKDGPYWFQLKCYAYALANMYDISPSAKLKLVLCFVDTKEVFSNEMSLEEVLSSLWNSCEKLSDLNKINNDYCNYCDFNQVCNKT